MSNENKTNPPTPHTHYLSINHFLNVLNPIQVRKELLLLQYSEQQKNTFVQKWFKTF